MIAQSNPCVLNAIDLGVSYGDSTAIARLDFDVRRGEFVALSDPRGAASQRC